MGYMTVGCLGLAPQAARYTFAPDTPGGARVPGRNRVRLPDTARADSMGSVIWAGLKGGDPFSMEERSGNGFVVNDSSGVTQLRWGWGD